MTQAVEAIEPNAFYNPREASSAVGISVTEVTAAIVRGDLKAILKPPGLKHRMIRGQWLLDWTETFIEA